MFSKTVLRGLYLSLAVSLSLLMSQWSYASLTGASFRSMNYRDRYIRHRGFLAYLEPINRNDEIGKGDASFKIVPGLAGRCKSFESFNYPGHFLRHQNYRLKLAKRTNERLFREDATFCIVNGLANSKASSSFESVNFSKHYIRHTDFELRLSPFEDSKLFREDATFIITGPVHTSDTEQIPTND
ncbi:AbfB domain-containing protein [Phormidesmis sp. 146-33]